MADSANLRRAGWFHQEFPGFPRTAAPRAARVG